MIDTFIKPSCTKRKNRILLLEEAVKKAGSQLSLSKQMKIDQGGISRMLRGEVGLSAGMSARIALYVGKDPLPYLTGKQ